MNPIAAQQVALDNALICPRLPNQEFVVPPSSDTEIVSFIKELRYIGEIDFVTKVYTDHMHQPWKTFAAVINRFFSGKTTALDKTRLSRAQILWGMYYSKNVDFVELLWENFMFQIDKRDSKKQEKIIFIHTIQDDSILGSLRFVSKLKNIKSETPKKARKFKKHASPSKKKTLVAIEEPAKKPAAKRLSTGVQIKDTLGVSMSKTKAPAKTERSKGIELLSEAALLEDAQLKKATKRIKREINIHQAGGSSEGADLESEVPDEQKGKSTDTSEGTGLIPGILICPKKILLRVKETQEDEFVHTPENYIPSDDENVADEEYKQINKEIYDDVNVELKDVELADEGKDDEEMTDAKKVNVENENVNQEVAGDQVNDDAQATVTAALATQKTEVPLQIQHEDPSSQTSPLLTVPVLVIPKSSTASATTIPPLISPFIPLPQQSTPIPTPTTTEATISTTTAPDSSTLTAIHQRLFDLENEVKTLINVDHNLAIRAAIKSKVPTIIKEYLRTNMDDTLHKTNMEQEDKQQETKYTITSYDTAELQEFDQNRTWLKKRNPDDADKDEGPPARPDQGLKKKKTGKDTEPSKKAKSIRTSKGTTKSQPKSTGKSTQAEDTVFEAEDTQVP
ncbi:hypothetical protein Tco_0758879 [Tanacetum coccineum]